jgi:hypothetical protein
LQNRPGTNNHPSSYENSSTASASGDKVWVKAHWKNVNDNWVWIEGYWKNR